LCGGESEAGFVQAAGVGGGEDLCREVGFGRDLIEPLALKEPVLVTASLPFPDVGDIEVLAVVAEALDDVGVGKAVEEHLVDLVANGIGETGDFSVAAMLEAEEVFSRGGGLVIFGSTIEDFRLRIHKKSVMEFGCQKMKSRLVEIGRDWPSGRVSASAVDAVD